MSGRAYSPEVQAADEAFQRAGRAVGDELRNRLRTGEWLAWGREGSPVEPYRRLPADAWKYLEIDIITNVVSFSAPSRQFFIDNCPIAVPGPTARFFNVVVARQAAASKRGRKPYTKEDAPLLSEMHKMILADPTLRPYTAAMWLIENGRLVAGGISTAESKAKRLAEGFVAKFGKLETLIF
jgi:hypothetical protein